MQMQLETAAIPATMNHSMAIDEDKFFESNSSQDTEMEPLITHDLNKTLSYLPGTFSM